MKKEMREIRKDKNQLRITKNFSMQGKCALLIKSMR